MLSDDFELALSLQQEELQEDDYFQMISEMQDDYEGTSDYAGLHSSRRGRVEDSIDYRPEKDLEKGKQRLDTSTAPHVVPLSAPSRPTSTCGICGEHFCKVSNPVQAALSASGSSRTTEHGISLTCPAKHEYCLSCMTSYLRTKLALESADHVFPVLCPECPRSTAWEMDDETAAKVLGQDLLDVWHFQRLKVSLMTVSGPCF